MEWNGTQWENLHSDTRQLYHELWILAAADAGGGSGDILLVILRARANKGSELLVATFFYSPRLLLAQIQDTSRNTQ